LYVLQGKQIQAKWERKVGRQGLMQIAWYKMPSLSNKWPSTDPLLKWWRDSQRKKDLRNNVLDRGKLNAEIWSESELKAFQNYKEDWFQPFLFKQKFIIKWGCHHDTELLKRRYNRRSYFLLLFFVLCLIKTKLVLKCFKLNNNIKIYKTKTRCTRAVEVLNSCLSFNQIRVPHYRKNIIPGLK
jgi:hypothetical protein